MLANALLDKKGEEIVLLDVSSLVDYADCFVLANGTNQPHLQAMTDAVVRAASEAGKRPAGIEGRGGSTWILIDCGDVVVHLFSNEGRGFYDLDGLWCDAPRTAIGDTSSPPSHASAGG